MIPVDISIAAAVYVFASVIALLTVWMLFEGKKGGGRRSGMKAREVWQCVYCAHTYIDSRHEDLSVCPRCGSYNRKKSVAKHPGTRENGLGNHRPENKGGKT